MPFLQRKTAAALKKVIVISTIVAASAAPAFSQENPVGEFEGHADIGAPKLAGAASYDEVNQVYTLSSGGVDMSAKSDHCHFAWKKLSGDFILRTRVEFVGKGAVNHCKIGWMVRAGLEPDAPYADCAEHGDGLTALQFRGVQDTNTGQIVLSATHADVLQFERRGGKYIFSAARYGEPFVSAELTNLDLGDDVYAGLFVCSQAADVAEKATFRDVRIIRPAKPNFTPYRDFIGSVLEILEVHSGRLEKIYSSPQPFEAPNWLRDGSALIYNVSGRAPGWGRLNRFDLATKHISPLDIGTDIANNNDHVLSFDGKQLGISGTSARLGGSSRVFTVPLSGGTPKLITTNTPSYLHGWSPDGRWLVFAGNRQGKFDIFKIRADGSGKEIRLTDAPGVSDGPEFTPDGKWVYFNSARTGKMQLWRMKPDGTGQEQITSDEFNDWFPHVSPDGKWIAFLSFGADVKPGDHPYYKHVYLRLMPIEGGKPRVIAYVYGGQGTMNVPSWSPDSQRIAFVSNSGGL